MGGYFLAEPEADAADVAAAFFKLGDVWREADKAASFEFGLKLWRFVGHNDMFAGADEVAGEAVGAFVEIDDDFVEIVEGLELSARGVVESLWAVSDGVLVDDRESKIEIIPEAVGVVGERVDVLGAVGVELRFGMELNQSKAEGFGSKSLSGRVGTIARAGEKIFAATERVALP